MEMEIELESNVSVDMVMLDDREGTSEIKNKRL